jgi:hypothetical protein
VIRAPRLARRLYGPAVARPRWTLALAALFVLALSPGLARLRLETGGQYLVPRDAAEVLESDTLAAKYGVGDQLVVVVEAPGPRGIYRADALRTLLELTEALAALPEVGAGRVRSLANEKSDRVYTGTLDFRPWLVPFPQAEPQLDALRRDLEAFEIYSGALISLDRPASAAALLVDVAPGVDRARLQAEVRAGLDAVAVPRDLRLHLVGAPVAESELGRHLLADLVYLVPLSLLVMVLLFRLAFRGWTAALLPLFEVGPCLLVTFALVGWSGTPVYLTMTILPVILTAVGVADELHIFTRYRALRRERPAAPRAEVVLACMDELATPVVRTSLTTTIGFLSFCLSPIAPVRSFGLFMAVGVLACLLWSLTVIPACLRLTSIEAGPRGGEGERSRAGAFFARIHARRRRVLPAALIAIALTALGISRLRVQDSWIGGFAESSELRRATVRVEELFGGTHLLRVEVAADDGLLRPERLRQVGALEEFLARQADLGVGLVLGPYAHLATMNFVLRLRQEGTRTIPEDPRRLDQVIDHYRRVQGQERLDELLAGDGRAGLVTVFLEQSNFEDTGELLRRLREFERAELAPAGLRLRLGGDVAVSQAMIRGIVGTQRNSLLLSLAAIALFTSLVLRSLSWGIACILPSATAVLVVFGLMGWLGVPLGVATSMFAATVLGIGIDYAIHLVEALRRGRAAGLRGEALVTAALERTAPAITIDALAIAAAFGLLGLSSVPSNARLGLLVATSALVCAFGTLVLFPAWLGGIAEHEERESA